MLKTFADGATEDIYYARNTKAARRAFPQDLWPIIRRKLAALNAAAKPEDLANSGNRLEQLTSTKPGFYSMRVNNRFRITFRFEGGHALDVACEDYH